MVLAAAAGNGGEEEEGGFLPPEERGPEDDEGNDPRAPFYDLNVYEVGSCICGVDAAVHRACVVEVSLSSAVRRPSWSPISSLPHDEQTATRGVPATRAQGHGPHAEAGADPDARCGGMWCARVGGRVVCLCMCLSIRPFYPQSLIIIPPHKHNHACKRTQAPTPSAAAASPSPSSATGHAWSQLTVAELREAGACFTCSILDRLNAAHITFITTINAFVCQPLPTHTNLISQGGRPPPPRVEQGAANRRTVAAARRRRK